MRLVAISALTALGALSCTIEEASSAGSGGAWGYPGAEDGFAGVGTGGAPAEATGGTGILGPPPVR